MRRKNRRFRKRGSNLEDQGFVQNHSEPINDQEGETQSEISEESEIGKAEISNLGWAGVRRYYMILKCSFRRRRMYV